MKLYIVDAFTEELFGGNPAGVVILDGDLPSEEMMTKTAAELRYSETAFVKKTGDGRFHTRYFTPAAEVGLCGHATIATFTVLRELGIAPVGTYTNHTMEGDLEIRVEATSVLMEMGEPKIEGELRSNEELTELYGIMGIEDFRPHIMGGNFEALTDVANGTAGGQPVHPQSEMYPKMVSTGLLDIMLPVADRRALDDINPYFPALTELSRRYGVVGVHAFCPPDREELVADSNRGLTALTGGVTAHARNFAPLYEIDEEAATGTSNGALTYYLQSVGVFGNHAKACIIQGEKMERPSAIRTEIEGRRILVGGNAVILAKGEIYL